MHQRKKDSFLSFLLIFWKEETKESEPIADFTWKIVSVCIEQIDKSESKEEIEEHWKWIKEQHSKAFFGEPEYEIMPRKAMFVLGLKEATSYTIPKKEVKRLWKKAKQKCELGFFGGLDLKNDHIFAIGYLVGKGEIK